MEAAHDLWALTNWLNRMCPDLLAVARDWAEKLLNEIDSGTQPDLNQDLEEFKLGWMIMSSYINADGSKKLHNTNNTIN